MIIDYGNTATNSESLELIKSYGKKGQDTHTIRFQNQSEFHCNKNSYILAQIIVNLLNDNDQLMLMAVSNTIHTVDGSTTFLSMNSTSKCHMRKFIDSLEKEPSKTNHSLAFQYAFDWIASQIDLDALSIDGKVMPMQMLYVSKGYTLQLPEVKNILDAIAVGQSHLKQPVVINTCSIILGM